MEFGTPNLVTYIELLQDFKSYFRQMPQF